MLQSFRSMLLLICCVVSASVAPAGEPAAEAAPKKIRVRVWDEQQPTQKTAYPNFLGNQIAAHLRQFPELEVTSVNLNDPEQGLSTEALEATDVLVWWGHVRHKELAQDKAQAIVERIKAGKLSLIALHSAHWAKPFVEAMNERAIQDARASLSEADRATAKLVTLPWRSGIPKAGTPLTPSHELKTLPDGSKVLEVKLPGCIFPAWRADGAPSHVKTLRPEHPIAAGIPATFDIPQTEMYAEPYHIPTPDAVLFEERWDKGEWFRSGCLWRVGAGQVFYFRPGHETYGIFKQELPLKILSNACLFLGKGAKK